MKNITHRFINASAGTGKTFTIVKEVKQMVTEDEIPLDKLLIVTYTEKAVGELKERIREALSKSRISSEDAQIYTIHSFCQRVLQDYAVPAGQPSELELIDESELASFLDKWIRDELPEEEIEFLENRADLNKSINALKRDLSKAVEAWDSSIEIESSDKWTSDDTDKEYLKIFKKERIENLAARWQEEKKRRKVQTYNDMIRSVRDKIVPNNSGSYSTELARILQDKYKGAIIDEFQDTNRYQWEIFRELFFNDDHFLFVVGDPKQSIYSFQGADLNVYYEADKEFTKEQHSSLQDNWRSSEEMINACNDFFDGKFFKHAEDDTEEKTDNGFDTTFSGSSFPKLKFNKPVILCGKKLNPFWFYKPDNEEDTCDEFEFADFAVNRIIFCCSSIDGKHTNLQIPKLREKTKEDPDDYAKEKNNWSYSNVDYSDFAILARTSSELGAIESALRKNKVPYSRYKDRNLFNSMECQHWISLLSAIDADDFTGNNRAILSEALFTRFFGDEYGISLTNANSPDFDSPTYPLKNQIIVWHELAQRRNWAELFESIFEKTEIELRLSREKKYQSLSKFREIGMITLEMLYENACTLSDVIYELTKKMTQTPDEGDLVEKGTDKKCVRIMTIHASKGLEFPVVIPVAGFKGRNNRIPHVYSYYNNEKRVLSFSENGKKEYWKSQQKELRRLFYVAYTRARYLMIIPRYPEPKTNPEDMQFLRDAVSAYFEKHKDEECFCLNEHIYDDYRYESKVLPIKNQEVKSITGSITDTVSLLTSKHSYSSLAPKDKKKKDDDSKTTKGNEENRTNKDEGDNDSEDEELIIHGNTSIDDPNPLSPDYPKGPKAGNAVHTVFELSDFVKYGEMESYEQLNIYPSFIDLVYESFHKESYKIDEEDSKSIRKQTASYVWNTLNANLPLIIGSRKNTDNCFKLKTIGLKDKLAETEFHLNSEKDSDVIRHYCMGFMDLLFKRVVDGKEIFSIADWKTDTKFEGEQINYSKPEIVEAVVDSEYRIQRTLYSYCLIKWLFQFGKYGNSLKDVFDNHFGGIYYVMIRGCKENTTEGIYAHTWESWGDLESEFKGIVKDQMK